MMTNGTISFQFVTENGFSVNGDPLPDAKAWSVPEIPCLIRTNQHNQKGKVRDGKFEMSAYTIHLEMMEEITAKRVKLVNDRGNNLGEFEIQDIQYLKLVKRIKITV